MILGRAWFERSPRSILVSCAVVLLALISLEIGELLISARVEHRITTLTAALDLERAGSSAKGDSLRRELEREQRLSSRIEVGFTVASLLALVVLGGIVGSGVLAIRHWAAVARQAAKLSAHHLERGDLVLASAADGIVGLDVAGNVIFANRASARLLGRRLRELTGADFHQSVHPGGRCGVACVFANIEFRSAVEDEFESGRGGVLPVEYSVTPVDEPGEELQAVIVFRDITERREVERMKDEFLSIVSHELRTPLTTIRGTLGLLASGSLGGLDTKATRIVDLAVMNAERLIKLINDILDLEILDRSTMNLRPHDIGTLMQDAAECLLVTAQLRAVELVWQPLPAIVEVDGDRVVQAMTNLLSNAVKFTDAGGVVELSAQLVKGQMVEVSIRDTGRGIPAASLDTIFERFVQVNASDTREHGGTGLGLSICRQIIDGHGGTLDVTSEPGMGSTFSFRLPLQRAQSPRDKEVECDALASSA